MDQRDQNVNAYVIWLTGGVTLGPVNLTAQYLEASGDKDQEDNTQNQFYGIGCQTSDSFFTGGCDARVLGPTQLWFGNKGGRHNDGLVAGSRDVGGNTGGAGGRYSRGNGNRVFAFDGSVKGAPGRHLKRDARVHLVTARQAGPFGKGNKPLC